ncbi:hypothetical protein ACFP50_35140, partial [Streptomyces pratens]
MTSPSTPVPGPPGLHQALKDDLTFPLAWGASPVRDFDAWRRAARGKVEELLVVDDQDGTPYAPEFTAGPAAPDDSAGSGFTRESVTLSLTRYGRTRGVLLTPYGTGPFPAVLLLHDHGSRFDIGKEKCVRPWYDDARLASAEQWAARHFGGRFVGDELARRGYAVLYLDALGWGERGPLAYERQQELASNLFHLGSSLAGLHGTGAGGAASPSGRRGVPEEEGGGLGHGRGVMVRGREWWRGRSLVRVSRAGYEEASEGRDY